MRVYEIAKCPCLSIEWSEGISLGVGQLRGFTVGDAVKAEVEYGLNQVELRVQLLICYVLNTSKTQVPLQQGEGTSSVRDLVYSKLEGEQGEM